MASSKKKTRLSRGVVSTKMKLRLDGDSIAAAISKELPGWKLVAQPTTLTEDKMSIQSALNTAERGTTIESLRKKFLGSDTSDSKVTTKKQSYGKIAKGRVTVSVAPKGGGPVKIADIVGRKVKIMQG